MIACDWLDVQLLENSLPSTASRAEPRGVFAVFSCEIVLSVWAVGKPVEKSALLPAVPIHVLAQARNGLHSFGRFNFLDQTSLAMRKLFHYEALVGARS